VGAKKISRDWLGAHRCYHHHGESICPCRRSSRRNARETSCCHDRRRWPFGIRSGKKRRRRYEYSFEDDTIEGDLTKPDGEYVEARKQVKHSNLIRIREEFKDKVMQSVGEL
jgi:hypothetical protein